MRCTQSLTLLASLLLVAGLSASSQADELAQQGRSILNRHEHAVVTVEVVLKLSSPSSGRSSEYKLEITGTVVDPSGLTVVALSACDPTELSRRLSRDYKVESEISDVKILLDDGTELPSEVVLRDRDLDLAFLRPKTKPTRALAAVDLDQTGPAQVLDEVITLNRLNKAASRAYAASVERISAVIRKPRTFYIPDSTMTSTAMGSPAFLPDGKLLGIFVMRALTQGGGQSSNYRQNMTSIILPAEDVLKAAKQAPEAKGDSDKMDATKDSTEEHKDAADQQP